MTPKEKAEELVNKFMSIKNIKLSDDSYIEWPTARQCAIYTTEEIINWHLEFLFISKESVGHQYWLEVKRIIKEEL